MTKPKVLVGVTGSVATIKLSLLVQQLQTFAEVQIVTTNAAKTFFSPTNIANARLWTDEDEWNLWHSREDPVTHIELRRWADLFVIAPLSANTLAKLAYGLSDNLLTCVARAWDYKKPFLVAPAMNTFMWDNPHTAKHISKIKKLGIKVVDPISKKLACGDVGRLQDTDRGRGDIRKCDCATKVKLQSHCLFRLPKVRWDEFNQSPTFRKPTFLDRQKLEFKPPPAFLPPDGGLKCFTLN